MKISFRVAAFITLLLLLIIIFKSCGSVSETKKKKSSTPKKIAKNAADKTVKMTTRNETINKKTNNSTSNDLTFDQKKTERLYKRLEYAYSLYSRYNYEGALNEVESLIRYIENDPYLEAQSWSLSSMIYDKQNKTSRRKRSLRKMVECIEALQKDPRYINVYKEGKLNQDFFSTIKDMGGEKYAETK